MSIDSSKISVGIGSIMQVFGGDRSSTRRTSSIVYSLKHDSGFTPDDEYTGGSALAVAARIASIFSLKNSDSLSAVRDGNVVNAFLSFFRTDDTDLHIFLGFPVLLAMHVLQYKFSFFWYNECIIRTC